VIQPSGSGLRSGLPAAGADMLQSMRSRENGGAPGGVTDKCEYYILHRHRSPIGPLDLRPETLLLFLRSLTAWASRPRPPEVSAEVRMDHIDNRSIDPVQFSPIQSNPASPWHCTHGRALLSQPYDPPAADSGQAKMCPTPAKISILNWAQLQFERCTIYDNQGPIKISI
jgi:hypothetical protein